MLKTLLCAVMLLQMQEQPTGTLVVIVPTKDGLIAAADSRSTFSGKYFDIAKKLNILSGLNTIFSITGRSDFFPSPPPGVDLEEWLTKTPKLYSGNLVVEQYLREHKLKSLNDAHLKKLAEHYVASLNDFFSNRPDAPYPYQGKELCLVIIGQYNPKSRQSLLATFLVSVTTQGTAEYYGLLIQTYKRNDEVKYRGFGETNYCNKQVLEGPGKKFLDKEFFDILQRAKRISQLGYSEGAFLASSIITAASKMAEIVPPPSGIGGNVQVILIDGKSKQGYRELKEGRDFRLTRVGN
ncbi:MAG: hypothetical protein NT096_01110 [Proteobacteria bacterium]|nr:hypothetical protein [Pseudomonadota bacterium]